MRKHRGFAAFKQGRRFPLALGFAFGFPYINLGNCGTTQSGGAAQTNAVAGHEPYFTGSGGKGVSIAIIAPKLFGLAENQGHLSTLVQGELVSNFSGYSAIDVLDREHLDDQYAELLSGYYDDTASLCTLFCGQYQDARLRLTWN